MGIYYNAFLTPLAWAAFFGLPIALVVVCVLASFGIVH
jgi:hypothetical protein